MNRYGGHQLNIATDEHLVFDMSSVLVGTVKIAGDRSGPNIDVGPYIRITQVSQVSGTASVSDRGVLDFNEVADTDVRPDPGVISKDGEGADLAAFPDSAVSDD